MHSIRPTRAPARPKLAADWQQYAHGLRVLLGLHALGSARATQRRTVAWQRCTLALGIAVTQYFLSVESSPHAPRSPQPESESLACKATVPHSVSAG